MKEIDANFKQWKYKFAVIGTINYEMYMFQ